MAEERINRVLHKVLLTGMVLSMATMMVGLLLYIASGSGDDKTIPFDDLLGELANGTPLAIVQLGILMLIATPLMRVVAATVVFAAEKDRQFVLISLFVLIMIAVAMMVKL